MRKILIPLLRSLILPTAVRGFPWNNDIGEKIIIIEFIITNKHLFKNDLLKLF